MKKYLSNFVFLIFVDPNSLEFSRDTTPEIQIDELWV